MSAKPALRPDRTVGEALREVARQILADARKAIANPAKSDAEAVHEFRREMKRWRALLRLLDPFLGADGQRLRHDARDLSHALGGARDAQSALDALVDLAEHGLDLPKRSLATIRGRIEAIRQAAETTVLTGDTRLRVTATLDDAEAAVARWPLDALAFSEVAERLARGLRSARRALPGSWSDASAEELHDLRKRIINHRYQMEIVEPLWRRFGKMWIGEAQRLRDRLGKHQDLLVLARLIEPHQPLAYWRARLAPAIARRKAAHVAAAHRIAARLLAEKPQAFRRKLAVMWETAA